MAQSQHQEIISGTRETLNSIFEADQLGLWGVSFPQSLSNTDLPPLPPSSGKYYGFVQTANLDGALQSVVKETCKVIQEGVDCIFTNKAKLHNSTYWNRFLQRVWIDLGPGLSLCRGGKKEDEIRHFLLSPLLRLIADTTSMVMAPDGCTCREYCSSVRPETQVEQAKRRGRNAEVDYTLSGFAKNDAVYVIPIEAKRLICDKDISQLSQYMASLCHGRYLSECLSVGILMDQSTVRLAFSPLSSETVPLPIVLISPTMPWREDITLNRKMIVGMALLCNLRAKRVQADEKKWSALIGKDNWRETRKFADTLVQAELTQQPPLDDLPYWLTDVLRKLEEFDSMKEKIKQFEEIKEKLEDLQSMRDDFEEKIRQLTPTHEMSEKSPSDTLTPSRKRQRNLSK